MIKKKMLSGIVAIALVFMLAFGGLMAFLPNAKAEDSFQDPYAVNGVVYDKSGNMITGATVEVENLRTEQTLETVTNENGEYIVSLNSMSSGYKDGDSIKVTATKGTTVGSSVDEVNTDSFHTEVDVTLGETGDERDDDENLFLGLEYWVWIVIVVALILVGVVIYVIAKKDELGLGK